MIILINPRSAKWNHRIPLSILAVASGLEGKYPYHIVDQNFDNDIERTLEKIIRTNEIRYVGITVMPGQQLTHAIEISRHLKQHFPAIKIIWGGTFPSIYIDTVLESPIVDFVVWSQGEFALPELLNALENRLPLENIKGISFTRDGKVIHNTTREWTHPDLLPSLPYERIHVQQYFQRTYLGKRTTGYYSSFGCPFFCGFCSVVAMYNGKWLAQSPQRLVNELQFLQKNYGIDSVEFFDDNFFVSEKRTLEFCGRVKPMSLAWWAEGRSDTLMKFSDKTLKAMQEAGCRMIFTGAESGSDTTLDLMNKGGTQTSETAIEFAKRIKQFNIIPEFSFILGNPSEDVDKSLDRDFRYIRMIKEINPASEIIFHTYSPVLMPGAKIYEEAQRLGFSFPKTLEEWIEPQWEAYGARKSSFTPWLTPRHRRRIKNFEIVLNAYTPSIADIKITSARKKLLRLLSGWRYKFQLYFSPYEVRLVLYKLFKYRQPQIEGAEQYPT
jgi:anaerobic magnesium-protoporphyrin IX monomethyl ester cyclase